MQNLNFNCINLLPDHLVKGRLRGEIIRGGVRIHTPEWVGDYFPPKHRHMVDIAVSKSEMN